MKEIPHDYSTLVVMLREMAEHDSSGVTDAAGDAIDTLSRLLERARPILECADQSAEVERLLGEIEALLPSDIPW